MTPSSQKATLNAKYIIHRELNPQSMEVIENYFNTKTGERLSDTEELQTYIRLMSHIHCTNVSH